MLNFLKISIWVGFSLCLLTVAGCQSTTSFYRGYHAESASCAPLMRLENQQGSWKTFDLELNYEYDYKGDDLNISGTLDLGLYYEIITNRILSLDVYLFFLDDNTRVMETRFLSRELDFEGGSALTFAKHLKVPAGTDSISFGYEGKARTDGNAGDNLNGGGGGGSVEYFSSLPKRVRVKK